VSIRKRTNRTTGKVTGWQVEVTDGRGGQRQHATFATKREAIDGEARMRAAMTDRRALGVHAPRAASAETLTAWLETWRARDSHLWARSTRVTRRSLYDRWVIPLIGRVELRQLGVETLTDWREHMLTTGATPVIAGNAMRALSASLSAAVRVGKLPNNPLAQVQRPRQRPHELTALSAVQAEAIRAELPSVLDRALWGLQYAAGLRTSEAHALRWSDIDNLTHDGGLLRVDRAYVAGEVKETKTRRGRDVPVVGPLAADLMTLRALTDPAPDDLVCPSQAGTPINPNNWRNRVYAPAKRAAGVEFAMPKLGRKTYVSLRIHAGDPPVEVAADAGHSVAVLWSNYAREFERSRHTERVPMDEALRRARRQVSGSGPGTVPARPSPTPVEQPAQ